jgi:hypothetical protein
MLSPKRDMAAAQRFFRSPQTVAGRRPAQVTTDGLAPTHGPLPKCSGKRSSIGAAATKIIGSSRITAELNSVTTPCWVFKASDPRSAFVVPSMSCEIISDHDNAVTKSCPQPEEKNSFVRKWIPCNRPSWPAGKHILVQSGWVLLSTRPDVSPAKPVLTDPNPIPGASFLGLHL